MSQPTGAHLLLLGVSPELPSTLHMRFADGACLRVDVAELIPELPAPFEALRNPTTFMAASTGDKGPARFVSWPEKSPLTLSSWKLRAIALHQATGRGPVWVFKWMEHNGLTVAAAATALGVSRRMVVHYRSAKRPVPRKVMLAIRGWGSNQQPGWVAQDCTPETLRQWMARYGYSYRLGALALGVSRRMLAYYLSGQKIIPRRVALAMEGWRG